MSRRPRRRRAKRSTKSHGRQRRQQLSKEIRELYPPGSADGDPDAEWHAGLEDELDAELHRSPVRPRPPTNTGASAPKESTPGAREPDSADGLEKIGLVAAISSGACRVETEDSSLVDCVLPSELARDQRAAVAVGDRVAFIAHGAGNYRVQRVLERHTTLSRPDPHNPRLERVIAANIDVAVHVASVVEPALRPALIDRYLIAIDRGGAEAVVCVNKIDLLTDSEARQQELERLDAYRRLALEILPISAVTGEGLEALRDLLAGKTAVFVGHSGVGKSSLLNALEPETDAVIGQTSGHGKGRHTTTRSSLYRLAGDITVIDTPGIREFGLWELTASELRAYFPDFDRHSAACRFNNCSHSHEPDCAVRQAVETGEIARPRFETYLRILASL